MVWTPELLQRSPALELRAACSDLLSAEARAAAWTRYEVKRTYELVCGARVETDLNDLEPQMAAEVTRLRSLAGGAVPWLGGPPEREYRTDAMPPLTGTALPTVGPGSIVVIRVRPPEPQLPREEDGYWKF